MKDYELLDAVSKGRLAELSKSELDPILEERRKIALGSLVGKFRDGTIDEKDLLRDVATLTAIEDIKNDIQRKINKGMKARGGINANGDSPRY